ncbi:MAG: hypothetical protein KDE27_10170 [Planctomycetes bacterium]|nr:hypothetical protein [Planctomycetota bacterium]
MERLPGHRPGDPRAARPPARPAAAHRRTARQQMTPTRSSSRLVLTATALLAATFAAGAPAQSETEQLERLRKEQQEILRKTERLQALMERLRQRYEREGKKEQVDLLTAGLAHLSQSEILRDVASIRDDLGATALSEAVRKQSDVVGDLEKLLNILLDRRSVESITELEKAAAERALAARQLEQRQRDLQRAAEEALRSEPSAAEQQLGAELGDLAAAERREADRNNRESGQRRPFLESALERIERLLHEGERLEGAITEEAGARESTRRQRQFDFGDLIQQTKELARHVREQGRQAEIGSAASELDRQAEGNDTQAVQQAKNRLEALVNDAPRQPIGNGEERIDGEWRKMAEALREAPAGETPTEREELGKLATGSEELAKQRGDAAAARNGKDSGELAQTAQALAEKLAAEAEAAGGKPEQSSPPRESLAKAAAALEQARDAAAAGDTTKARQQVDHALTALEQARRQHADAHPDAEQQAGSMAAESTATAQELQNAPNAEDAERAAAADLEQAADALRQAQNELAEARQQQRKPDGAAAQGNADRAREDLERAKATIAQALAESTAGREQDLQAAAERQQQLAEQARQTAEAMQRAVENGQLTPEQAEGAKAALERAQQGMQRAGEQLQNGQQSSAAQQQRQAAEQLEQAAAELEQNRPVTQQQKDALKAEAERQQELAEDIVRLAQMLEEQEQRRARQKLDEAAQAAQRAQQAMERGDEQETREQQEEARQKLDEAAKELEQERDRYQDLRQEELLFKMKEELLAFLERQRPITEQTLQAQKTAETGRLSRPLRHKLNQLGEEELELAGRIDFLVQALEDEGNMVYQTVLRSNLEDLHEIGDRLGGRAPDVGSFTTLMQQDVERRSEELLAALEQEQKRREQERQQQQQQQQGQNKFNPQRERLVGLIAELEMLKTLLHDTDRANNDLDVLISSRGDESISESEAALVERLAHRHSDITKLFLQIKAAVEETMQAMQEQQGGDDDGQGRGR